MGEPVLKVWADFNGLFGGVLCLSHAETARDEHGDPVILQVGMTVMAFDGDLDDAGNPDNIIATGTVARPPDWLKHKGSHWVLLIDSPGVRHQSDLANPGTA